MLNILLSYLTAVCSLWWLLVPIIVMGIFSIIGRIILQRF